MDNVTMKVAGAVLTITIDLSAEGVPSSTGKTKLVATTHGAQPIPYGKRDGLKISLNLTAPNGR